jgi:hypothetical protein
MLAIEHWLISASESDLLIYAPLLYDGVRTDLLQTTFVPVAPNSYEVISYPVMTYESPNRLISPTVAPFGSANT